MVTIVFNVMAEVLDFKQEKQLFRRAIILTT